MKQVILDEAEVRIIVAILKSNWIPINLQKAVFDIITKIEKELEN